MPYILRKGKGRKVVCPRCQGFKDTRRVPLEKGFDPRLQHYVCDYCLIGWYQLSHATNANLIGNIESAKAAYVLPIIQAER